MKKIFPILLYISLLSYDGTAGLPDTTKVGLFRIEKGGHFFKPRNLLSRLIETPDTLFWECRFDTSCCYLLLNEDGTQHVDQWDFNKISGIAFNPLNPIANTAMVGWRYNPERYRFELLPYWHINKQRFYNEKNMLFVQENQDFTVTIIINKKTNDVTVQLHADNNLLEETKTFSIIPATSAIIQPYFGGTSRAPKAMRLMSLLKTRR